MDILYSKEDRIYPLAFVIIPAYKAVKYIRNCLDSVLCQTFQNVEVMCSDSWNWQNKNPDGYGFKRISHGKYYSTSI